LTKGGSLAGPVFFELLLKFATGKTPAPIHITRASAMESSQIKGIFIIVFAAMFAVYLGVAAATASFEAIAWVAGFVGVAFVLALGKSVWSLIPVTLVLQGTVNALPGSPPAWAATTVVVAAVYVMRLALRRPDFVFRIDWLDIAILFQLLVVAQAYLRNPTGLLILGGNVAGGKPYFVFALAIVAYFGIAFSKPDVKVLKRVVVAMILIQVADGILLSIADRSPSISSLILPIYSNVNLGVAMMSGGGGVDYDNSRGGAGFSLLGKAMVIPCFSLNRPLNCLSPFHPVLLLITGTGCVLMLLSGFRGGFGYLGAVFIVSALIRRRYADIAVMSLVGALMLIVILATGAARSLPYGVQRVLSVIPMVDVRSDARADASNSSEWRFEMWRLAMTTDRYITNKWLGDGFAISSREMKAISDEIMGYAPETMNIQEKMLAQGSYHGFHVETIRFTGAVGLIAALVMMGVGFSKALKLVRFYRDDKLFPFVAYICIPSLLYPFWAMLIFGSYRTEFPQFIAMAGMLKMLDNLRLSSREAVKVEKPVAVNLRPAAVR
jgi:hypothetical protein